MIRVLGLKSRQLRLSQKYAVTIGNALATSQSRSYTQTPIVLEAEGGDEAAALLKEQKEAITLRNKEIANDYNRRRAAYNRQVTLLRKEYASEVSLQRAQDEAEKLAKRTEEARSKLERQRLKNIKAAQSAIRQKQIREERHLEFQEELKIAQIDRDAKNDRFTLARQMVIDELEKEAPLWLTTPEEVEAAFTREAEQELWARPNGVLGAPMPTDDADFWKYETRIWQMRRTYKSRRDVILEQLEEEAYMEANVDPAYWTPERVKYREALEEKAKLRAMVGDAGRRALLLKQQEMLQERFSSDPSSIPSAMPAPNVTVLRDINAMELEGSKFLMSDPTKFFDFDQEVAFEGDGVGVEGQVEKRNDYAGPTLGVPVALKNPIAHAPGDNRAYPLTIGTTPQADQRSAKEKKRDEREQQMLAAAAGKAEETVDDMVDIDDTIPEHLRVDYNQEVRYDSDDEWEARLDPETDGDLYKVPAGLRIKESEQEYVAQKLDEHIKFLEEQIRRDVDNARLALGAARVAGVSDDKHGRAPAGSNYYINTSDGQSYTMEELGIDHEEVDDILSSLTEEQLVCMHAIDNEAGDTPFTPSELREKLTAIPGLTEAQIDKIVSLEETLASKDEIKKV